MKKIFMPEAESLLMSAKKHGEPKEKEEGSITSGIMIQDYILADGRLVREFVHGLLVSSSDELVPTSLLDVRRGELVPESIWPDA